MNKREKIFVALTIIVALGAGIFLYLDQKDSPSSKGNVQSSPSTQTKEAMTLIEKSQGPDKIKTSKYQLQKQAKHIILAASEPWSATFYHPERHPDDQNDHKEKRLNYSGYMKTNGQYMALINGRPYALGDRLRGTHWSDYQIRSITPQKVVLQKGQGEQIAVALQDGHGLVFHEPNPLATGKGQ